MTSAPTSAATMSFSLEKPAKYITEMKNVKTPRLLSLLSFGKHAEGKEYMTEVQALPVDSPPVKHQVYTAAEAVRKQEAESNALCPPKSVYLPFYVFTSR